MDFKDKYFRVLDKGFIALKETMGDDYTIEQAARTSYGKGTRKRSETRGLLRYLMRHKHTTPFEMVEFKFHIKVPMDCWRQWIRHRTANVNEYSTRYSVAIDDCQQTDEWRIQSKSNKQGSDGLVTKWPEEQYRGHYVTTPANETSAWTLAKGGTAGEYLSFQENKLQKMAREIYEERLHFGVAREQARKDLPLSNYTVAYWKCDLHNIFHFLRLRCDSHAQKEIRDYAMVMASLVKAHCPLAFEAWYDYSFGAVNFTRLDRKLLYQHECLVEDYAKAPYGDEYEQEILKINFEDRIADCGKELGMSKREIDEFWQKIKIPTETDFTLDNYEIIDMENEDGTEEN